MIVGYTPGGAPIIYSPNGKREKRRRRKFNPRFKCSACGHATTRNQLRCNGSVCFACKAPIEAELYPPKKGGGGFAKAFVNGG